MRKNLTKEPHGIVNWIKENREKEEWAKDPNAYEMTNVFLLGAKYASEGVEVNTETLKEMWEIRSQDFARCGVREGSTVYGICEDAYKASQQGRALVNDEASHHALRKMAGIGWFLCQQKTREGKIEYNNPNEFLELVEASRTLKGVHPELYERYGFARNLEIINEILPENALSGRIQKAMEELAPNPIEEKRPK